MKEALYKYVGINGLIDILKKGRLKWSAPKTFNDPFDLQINLLDYDLGEFRRITEEKINDIVFGDESPPEDTKGLYLNLRHMRLFNPNVANEDIKDEIKGICDEILRNELKWREGSNNNLGLENARVLCLSHIHNSILMWGHYADSHMGGVIKFKSGNDLILGNEETQKIIYSKERPDNNFLPDYIDNLLKIDSSEFNLGKYLWVKFKDWEYEEEWRLIRVASNEDEAEFHDFPPKALEEIYLGCKITPLDKIKVQSLLEDKFSHVKVFQASKSSKRYKLDFSLI